MKINTDKLKTYPKFGILKNISKQRVYKLVEAERLDSIEIDGVKFIIMNNKAIKYIKKI